jgi:hypothetical protein
MMTLKLSVIRDAVCHNAQFIKNRDQWDHCSNHHCLKIML